MGALHRLGVGPHLVEIHVVSVEFRFFLGPDRFHCQDLFPKDAPALFEIGAVVPHLLGVPAAADAENEPSSGQHVQSSDLLGGGDGDGKSVV